MTFEFPTTPDTAVAIEDQVRRLLLAEMPASVALYDRDTGEYLGDYTCNVASCLYNRGEMSVVVKLVFENKEGWV